MPEVQRVAARSLPLLQGPQQGAPPGAEELPRPEVAPLPPEVVLTPPEEADQRAGSPRLPEEADRHQDRQQRHPRGSTA